MRNEVIPIESYMRQQWRAPLNFIKVHSAPSVYRAFLEQTGLILGKPCLQQANMRRVTITGSTELKQGVVGGSSTRPRTAGHAPNAFDSESRIVKKWVVFLEVRKKNSSRTRPKWIEILENPLGFVVTRYRAEKQPEENEQ